MKKLVLFCLILTACQIKKNEASKYKEGDFVVTKYGDTVLLYEDRTECCDRWMVKKRVDDDPFRLKESELSEIVSK